MPPRGKDKVKMEEQANLDVQREGASIREGGKRPVAWTSKETDKGRKGYPAGGYLRWSGKFWDFKKGPCMRQENRGKGKQPSCT